MSLCRNTCLLVKRRLCLQTVWRHPFSLAAEICIVLVAFGFVLKYDHLDPENVKKLLKDQNLPKGEKGLENTSRSYFPDDIVYGPQSNYTRELIAEIRRQLEWRGELHVVSAGTTEEVLQTCFNRFLRPLAHRSSKQEVICIQFWDPEGRDLPDPMREPSLRPAAALLDTRQASNGDAAADNSSLSYTLVYHLPPKMFPPNQSPLDAVPYLASYNGTAAAPGADSMQRKILDRITQAQRLINTVHIKLQSKNESMPYQVVGREMPMMPPFLDVKAYRNYFFFALSIAFCLPLIFRIGDVTNEISSGLLEHQRLMGLSGLQFWLGHFVSALVVALVEGFLVVSVIYFSVQDFSGPEEETTWTGYYNRHPYKRLQEHPFPREITAPLSALQYEPDDDGDDEDKYEVVVKHERVTRDFLDVPYLSPVDVSLVAVVFFTFHVSHTLLALLIACVLPLGRWAVLLGFGVFMVLPSYDRASFNFFAPSPLSAYLAEDRITKLRRCIYPNAATDNIMKIIAIFSDFELNAGWNVIEKLALGCDNVTIVEVWSVMGATALVAVVLIWYLSHVLPWSSASPQHPLFPLLPWYWVPWRAKPTADVTAPPLDEERFDEPPETPIVIECRGLKKFYGSFAALNGVYMTIHEDQVTVLLGHNGAGKTTLFNILTGLQTSSAGSVTVAGWDVHNVAARGMVGYCPQNDVFFDDLTVEEHLVYYAGLRGVAAPVAQANMQMKSLKLMDKADNFPDQLSGGYKRKLSVALALVSSPKLLILDEPTSGMDPEMRRSFWKIIKRLRGEVTVLLSTHDMEEADAVGDRIIVMHSGRVICSGSTSFLKDACGVGYKLTIGKAASGFKLKEILALVRKTAPLAVVERERDEDVTIALHTFNCDGFEAMFRQLELGAARMGLTGVGVTVATMNDAYVKIHTEWATEEEPASEEKEPDAGATQPGLAPRATGASVAASKEAGTASTDKSADDKTVNVAPPKTATQKFRRSKLAPDEGLQFIALLCKRYTYLTRTKTLFLTGWLLPIVIALLTGIVLDRRQDDDVSATMLHINLSAQAQYGPHVRSFLRHVDPTKFSRNYEVLLESRNISVDPLCDPRKELLDALKKGYFAYGSLYAMGGVFNDTEMQAWYNPTSLFSKHIGINFAYTALLRTYSEKPRSYITTDVALYPLTEHDITSFGSRIPGYYKEKAGKEEREQRLRQLLGLVRQNWLYWGCIVTISVGLVLTSFVAFPAAEAHNGARSLQLMTGVPACVYVTAHFLFDLVFYLVPMATIYGTFIYLQRLSFVTLAALVLIIFSFAPLGILLPYLVTDNIESDSTAHTVIVGLFAIGGPATFLLYILLAIITGSAGPRIPLLFFPPFLLGAATIRAVNLEFEEELCTHLEVLQTESKGQLNTDFCEEINPFGSGIIHCCKMLSAEGTKRDQWHVTTPFSLSLYGIGLDLILMLALAVPVYCFVLRRLSSAYGSAPKMRDLHTHPLDDDVDREKELVNSLCRKKKFPEHVLLVRNLHKFFGEFYAVRGVYLALRPGECFGLVGVNGAGKTTTFQMLTALVEMSDGNAYMNSLVLSKQPCLWQSFIGYCPQSDALLGKLNAYQTLFLFGRLRGVRGKELRSMVNRLIKVVDLQDHATKPCEYYSGGQKRKLSIAVAMVGFPPVVFLDEPFAGVDVISRNNMRETMTALKESTGTAIVLTSHNMAECEVSCDRIGIMVKGQMTCLGSLQHLKTKFGKGITIQFVVPLSSKIKTEDLNKGVIEALPGARQLDVTDGLRYFLDQRPAWSILFRTVSALQKTFEFDYIIVTDTNLEELFLGFAQKAREEAKLAIND